MQNIAKKNKECLCENHILWNSCSVILCPQISLSYLFCVLYFSLFLPIEESPNALPYAGESCSGDNLKMEKNSCAMKE